VGILAGTGDGFTVLAEVGGISKGVIGGAQGCLGAPPPTPKVPLDALTVLYVAAFQFVIIERRENSLRTSFAHTFSLPGAAKKSNP